MKELCRGIYFLVSVCVCVLFIYLLSTAEVTDFCFVFVDS